MTILADEQPVVLDVRVVKGSGGGPDKTILNSPRFLGPLGYRMLCAYMHAPGDPGIEQLRRKADRWGATFISIADHGPLDLGIVRRLLRICRENRVRIFHAHDYKSNVLGVVLARLFPMRLMTTIHGWVQRTWRTPLYYALDRWSLPSYEKVLCVSQDLVDTCVAAGVPRRRCALLDNAIDTDEFTRRQERSAARRSLGLPADRLLIGAVGRLSAEKGFDVLIRAVQRLVESDRDVGLVLVGEGEEKPRLERLIAELHLSQRVHWLGYRSDVRPVYEALDVFALSSLREGLPNVVLEAMAMEVPVVATRIAGIPTLVDDGHTGLIADPGSVDSLVRGIQRFIDDSRLCDTIRQAARECVVSKFSFAQRMQKIVEIYDEVLHRC